MRCWVIYWIAKRSCSIITYTRKQRKQRYNSIYMLVSHNKDEFMLIKHTKKKWGENCTLNSWLMILLHVKHKVSMFVCKVVFRIISSRLQTMLTLYKNKKDRWAVYILWRLWSIYIERKKIVLKRNIFFVWDLVLDNEYLYWKHNKTHNYVSMLVWHIKNEFRQILHVKKGLRCYLNTYNQNHTLIVWLNKLFDFSSPVYRKHDRWQRSNQN